MSAGASVGVDNCAHLHMASLSGLAFLLAWKSDLLHDDSRLKKQVTRQKASDIVFYDLEDT